MGNRIFSGTKLSSPIIINHGKMLYYVPPELAEYTVPNTVTTIHSYAFFNSGNLIAVTIPDSVTTIGDSAFEYCHQVKSITIPTSVTSIGETVFDHCEKLIINCPKNSYAQQYAMQNNIKYEN